MHWGGYLGGPVFKKVMSFVLESKHIAPTGTKIVPIALSEKALNKTKANTPTNSASGDL